MLDLKWIPDQMKKFGKSIGLYLGNVIQTNLKSIISLLDPAQVLSGSFRQKILHKSHLPNSDNSHVKIKPTITPQPAIEHSQANLLMGLTDYQPPVSNGLTWNYIRLGIRIVQTVFVDQWEGKTFYKRQIKMSQLFACSLTSQILCLNVNVPVLFHVSIEQSIVVSLSIVDWTIGVMDGEPCKMVGKLLMADEAISDACHGVHGVLCLITMP